MHIGKIQFQASYFMNDIVLDNMNQETDLGVVIDGDLKVSSQCIQAYSEPYKANRILGMINRTIQFKSKDIMLNLYKALVRPLLEYCTAAWLPHYTKD